MSALFSELEWRGLIHQVTSPQLVDRLNDGALAAYIGFDPTADSLHIGHLLQLCNLRRLQEHGHRPIALAGGGTGMIGDPGGKSEERSLLSEETLAANLAGIRDQLGRFLDFTPSAGPAQALLVDNGEWLWPTGLLPFLRDVGKHFTVNQMVTKESVRSRLEEREHGISFTEFSYMLLQAYDFLQLFDRHGCTLQMGASDQWGNITMGIELIRKVRGQEVFGLTTPLVLKADGTKFGKSETGAVWLDAERTSPYELFQFFVRTEDAMVGTYLRYYTWLSRERIEELDAASQAHPERREGQLELARAVTALVHGDHEAAAAERAAQVLFGGGELGALDERTLLYVFSEAPATDRSRADLEGPGLSLVEALHESGLVSSRSAARTAISQGGAYVNNGKATDVDQRLTPADLVGGRYIVLRRGKRDHHLVRFT